MWREVLAQFVNAGAWTPNPLHLLVLLGIPFLVALLAFIPSPDGGRRTTDGAAANHRELFLKTWFVINFFMVYVPLSYQIHYLNGWQVPIAILATMALYRRIQTADGRRQTTGGGLWSAVRRPSSVVRYLPALLVIAALPTNAYLLAWRFVDLARHDHPYYLTRDEWEALRWLNQNAPPDAVVFSSIDVGQYVPSSTRGRAFLAHWAMTADLYRKQDLISRFFDPAVDDAERAAILQTYNVQYIIWGEAERELGAYDPGELPFAERVFDSPQAAVYRVNGLSTGSGNGLGDASSGLGK
jgi:hypothetical protein